MILSTATHSPSTSWSAIAHDFAPVALTDAARARVQAARTVVDEFAQRDAPTYGINTGFGNFAEVKIPAESLVELQLNLLRSHAAGVGEPLPVPVVRATMALRANVLAKGFSGIRVETLELLIALLNRRVHPVVPSRGSVGASGDLAPLAHLALVLIGEGEAWHESAREPGAAALARAGLTAGDARAQGRARAHQRHAGVDALLGLAAGRRGTAGARRRHRRGAEHRRAAGLDQAVRRADSRRARLRRPGG